MTLRNYSPEEITKIQYLGAIPAGDLRQQSITDLSRELSKPRECIAKRLEYESKQPGYQTILENIKTTIMANVKTKKHNGGAVLRYSQADKARIRKLKNLSDNDRLKAFDKIATDLGRTSDAIYQAYSRLTRRARKREKAALTTEVVAHKVTHITPRKESTVDSKKELRVSFSDIKINMETKEVIFTF